MKRNNNLKNILIKKNNVSSINNVNNVNNINKLKDLFNKIKNFNVNTPINTSKNSNTNKRNLYLYWVGNEYKLISILRKLIYLHSINGIGYNVILISDNNIKDYIINIPVYFNKLIPAHQADFVRVNVICDYGGIWLDSDTLIIDSIDSLFNLIEKKNGFFIKENNSILCNGIFGSKPNTQLMIKWKTEMINKLDNTQGNIKWSDIGCNMLENIYNTNKSLYDDYNIFNGLDNLYPINWNDCVSEFIKKPYDNYKLLIRDYQPLIILVNSVYKDVENMTEQEILENNMPLNYFINKSLENFNNIINNLNSKSYNQIIFENIYDNQLWNDSNSNIPLSGPGSSLQNAKVCSEMLNEFIYDNNCKSVLDLGCGDLTWISKTLFFNDNSIKYTGIDIVESLIISHSKTYLEKIFINEDMSTYKDFEYVDIIIIRDVIFHLRNKDIISIFDNIKNKFKFLLITSCINQVNTDNFDKWHFSEKNIHIEPFNRSNNFHTKIFEEIFNRNVYIYTHDNFYNL